MLTLKQTRAIVALIMQPTKKAAAKSAGIAFNTLLNWLKQDDFRNKYESALDGIFKDELNKATEALKQSGIK